jgi:transposase
VTEELEIEPPKLYVNRYIRPKYARPKDEGIVIARLPSRPIEKGIAGPGLIAYTLISKYVDHMPLYRQIQQHKRQGVVIAESTINGWKYSGCELIMPLVHRLRDQVLSSAYLMVDETPIRVLDPGLKGKTHKGYYWVYYDPLGGQVFFDYQKGRGRDGPEKHLKYFTGFLQTDGYRGYDDFASRKSITAVGCMAHARRYFVDAQMVDPDRAEWMLLRLQKLYAIERYARENQLSFDERYEERQENAAPIMKEIKTWLDEHVYSVLPQSAIGKAVQYMLNQWPRLENYLLDGRLEIDNNLVENAIRPIALGRKNYLFAGSHNGAEQAAAIYTLVANAKLQQVEPFAYLRNVLKRISDHPHKDIDQLLPKNWKAFYTMLNANLLNRKA